MTEKPAPLSKMSVSATIGAVKNLEAGEES